MHTSTAILAALAAFAFPEAQANPIEARQGLGFSLQQQAYGKRLKNGPIALGNLYKKVDAALNSAVVVPSAVADAFAVATASQAPDMLNKRQVPNALTALGKPKPTTTSSAAVATSIKGTGTVSGSAAATPVNQFDTAYMIPITVGGTTVYVDVDTGSSDLWVLSNLQSTAQTGSHNTYKVNSANVKPGYSWNVTYLDGSTASGAVYNETVGMGGMTFRYQSLEAAKTASDAFLNAAYDGMLGLAFDQLNTVAPVQQKTLFNNIKNQLPSALFTSCLKHNAPGSFDFGYIDPTKYTGAITYANVDTSNGWWQFTAAGYSIGSTAAVSQSFAAVVDTGTTLLVLPSNIVNAYYAKVSGAAYSSAYGAWIYPCAAALPNLNIIVNGALQTVPASLMTYGPVDYNGNCYGGLQANDGIGIAILGTIFIKSQFVVYDQSTVPPRVGFAKQSNVNYS